MGNKDQSNASSPPPGDGGPDGGPEGDPGPDGAPEGDPRPEGDPVPDGPDSGDATGARLSRLAEEHYEGNASALARALGMKPTTFYKYVNGDRRPGPAVLGRLTRLGVSLHWLLTGEGPALRGGPGRFAPLPVQSAMGPSTIDGPGQTLCRIPLVQVRVGSKSSQSESAQSKSSQGESAQGEGSQGGDAQSEGSQGEDARSKSSQSDSFEGPYLQEVGRAEWLAEPFVRDVYGTEPSRLKGFRVSGDAMAGGPQAGGRQAGSPQAGSPQAGSLQPGDRVRAVLWQGEGLVDGGIYVIYREPGGVIYRRVRFEAEAIRLTADHPEVADQTVEVGAWHKRFRPVAHVVEIVRAV